jgi:hypothetical protein
MNHPFINPIEDLDFFLAFASGGFNPGPIPVGQAEAGRPADILWVHPGNFGHPLGRIFLDPLLKNLPGRLAGDVPDFIRSRKGWLAAGMSAGSADGVWLQK